MEDPEYKAREREKNKIRHKKWREKHPDDWREIQHWSFVKRKYGITKEEYFKLLERQSGVCAICGREDHEHYDNFAIDHDHETGEIRGLLCRSCNLLVGYAKDDPYLLLSAAEYLSQEVAS